MVWSIIGIVMNLIGTVLSLWTVLITSVAKTGTWGELYDRQDNFRKEKRRVIFGCIIILAGSILQIIGVINT